MKGEYYNVFVNSHIEMKILIISGNYPYGDSNNNVFVKQLVDKFCDKGHDITVISPQSLTNVMFRRNLKRPYSYDVQLQNGSYKLYSPKYISFSKIPFLSTFAKFLSSRVILKTIKKEKIDFDVIYAHFVDSSGTTAYKVHKKYNKPFFIALGESTFNFKNKNLVDKALTKANGLIAVSSEMKKRVKNINDEIKNNDITVQSNGFDSNLFYKIDKEIVRKELDISENAFVVAFVGSFINRKGVLRLDQALKEIDNPNIKAIYIGNGPQRPDYDNIIHSGNVLHEEINKYLNASDIFVLPTLNEGSCNAIIEAIACGLPIISSDKPFNDDILRDNYSIRIDSMSVKEIKTAILKLYENPTLRKSMSKNALEISEKFDLNKRAKNILNFIKEKI